MPKRLTEAQLETARTGGYAFPVPVVPPERAQACLDRFEAYERETGVSAPRDLRVKPHLLFRWMWELGTAPALLDAVEDLIGPDVMLVTSAVWAKNARDPAYVTWHQDSAYFAYDPVDVWSAWIGLTDATLENGCMRYKPGSHLEPERPHVETWAADNLLQRGQYIPGFDGAGAVAAEVGAGEATFHHFRLAHSSEPNMSDRRRIGVLFVFCPPYVRYSLGRYPARLVRGADRYGHWDEDPIPERDLDPAAVARFQAFKARYEDRAVRSEAERAGLA